MRAPTAKLRTVSVEKKSGPPTSIDDYLARTPEPARTTLEKLRKAIKVAAPKATEVISYGIPSFRYLGMLVGFGATSKHCALYVMSGTVLEPFKAELSEYDTSKGTIRFPVGAALPAALVKTLVKARMAENEAAAMAKGTGPKRVVKGATAVKGRKDASPVRAPRAAPEKRTAGRKSGSSRTDPAVVEFLRTLEHPLKKEIAAVRRIILGVDPEIREVIKWNAPSFRTTEDFATFNLRAKDRVRLIFHTGAKVKAAAKGARIEDPAGLLEWLAKDRCLVTLGDSDDIRAKRTALQAIVRAWIRQL